MIRWSASKLLAASFLVALAAPRALAGLPVQSVEKDERGATFHLQTGVLRTEVYNDRTVRVTYSPTDRLPERNDYVVNRQFAPTAFEWREDAQKFVLQTARMGVQVNRATGAVSFVDASGKSVLEEPADGGKVVTRLDRPMQVGEGELYRVQQTFLSPDDERLFGLSQSQDGIWNWRGMPIELRQHNTQAAFPVLVSSKGYGLLWNNASLTDFNPIDQEIKLTTGNETSTTGPTATEQLRGQPGNTANRNRSPRIGTFTTGEAGDYVFFAKDGDRRNDIGIVVNGQTITRIQNLWVPYTVTGRVSLPANTSCTVQLLGGGPGAKLFAAPVSKTTTFRSHFARAIDYVFFYGPDLDGVVSAYRDATGAAPLWPKWAYGFWQCRERYSSQQQILDTAAEFRKRQIPVDLLVQDWQYWGPHGWGAYQWDEKQYPDPASMIRALHEQNIRFMISVWSNPQGTAGADLKSKGLTLSGTDWVDAFNPAARELRWKYINDVFFKIGTDAWWQDATEPGDDGNSMAGRTVFAGPGDLHRNAYPLFANQTIFEGQKKASPDKRVVILTRSAFPGQQRYATALWSGDIGGNWEAFRRQIPAGLHMSVAGLPYWTTDTGGFFRPRDQYTSDDFAELLVRWFQYSTFCPIQRIHGYQSKTEFWNYPKAEETLVAYDKLRYRLLPYLYSTAWRVTSDHYTIMRPLAMDFRDDPTALDIDDQYMFGPSFLVSPMLQPKATKRSVYLPGKEKWTNFWTGEVLDGGKRVEVDAPREQIPVFVRAGGIVPIGQDLQYANEKKDGPIELRVYPGADGSFTLYEDDGDGYQYEAGARSQVKIYWNDATRTLTFGDRIGAFPGMATEQVFRVVWVRPGQGVGAVHQGAADAEIRYEGKTVTVTATANPSR